MSKFSQARLMEQEAIHAIAERLTELLELPVTVMCNAEFRDQEVDGIVKVGPFTFAIEFKGSSELAAIARGIDQIQNLARELDPQWIPLFATHYMTPSGRERCKEAGCSWIDLAGNASIKADGIHIYVEGRPNQFKQKGRPTSVFAPKSSRIARWLLIHPDRFFFQREIAQSTSMDEGFTSRIVSRLEDLRLIRRDEQGRICVSNPDLLLDAWAEEYDFFKHEIHRSHVSARSGEELLYQVTSVLDQAGCNSAATGLAAAWTLNRFAGFRIATIYLRDKAHLTTLRSHLTLRDDPRGANLWLVFPNDEGVFHGSAIHEGGVTCVHPVQAWLDLKGHPERAVEAASKLRANFTWNSKHAG